MSSLTKLERDKQKLVQDKCQQILSELLRDEDNKYCVDCDSKGPRWASWNLGIFLCIRCAGIHRNLGVHISKVKSVNLDSWTPEQVGSIQNMGNSKARAVYEANLPDNFSRPQADSALESFIRAKYEHKKYIAKEWVETPPKPAFDVETELKNKKEKKKNKIKPIGPISAQIDIQSNPIPRPTANVNGKIDKGPQLQQQKTESTPSSSADLLSLDLGTQSNNLTFGFFAPTEINQINDSTQKKSLDEEEKDFFNQKTIEQKDEKKLTKESILSLYSQTPNSNAMNGTFPHSLLTNNQFPNVNPLFSSTNSTNLASSTNPFLNNNSITMPGEFPQQQSLLQGISSLNLQSNQIPLGNTNNTHMNWFAGLSSGSSNTSAISNLSSTANPFIDQTTKNSKSNPVTGTGINDLTSTLAIDKKNDTFNSFW